MTASNAILSEVLARHDGDLQAAFTELAAAVPLAAVKSAAFDVALSSAVSEIQVETALARSKADLNAALVDPAGDVNGIPFETALAEAAGRAVARAFGDREEFSLGAGLTP